MKTHITITKFVCFVLISVGCQDYKKEKRTIQVDLLNRAMLELNCVVPLEAKLLIFPLRGCNSCSEKVLINLINNSEKINFSELLFFISGIDNGFVSLFNSKLPLVNMTTDNDSLLLRFGIVSIYPIFIHIKGGTIDRIIETRSDHIEEDIESLNEELFF